MPVVRVTVSLAGGAGDSRFAGRRDGCGDGRVLLSAKHGTLVALVLDPDLLLERAPQLVGGLLEFPDALAERPAQLWQLPRAEDDQRNDQNDDEFRHAD